VTLDSNRYIDINPLTDWNGQTSVTIRVTDPGALSNTDAFSVTVAANTAPSISGLPDQTLLVNSSLNNAIDLWAYTTDAQSADNLLTFSIDNTPTAGAGVTLDSNRYIDINPSPGWTGQTSVTIRATDPGALSSTDTFSVTVSPQSYVYLPLVVRNWPPLPDAPVLNAISNADGDGNYTVSWGAANLANTYTLQEDDNASFSSPATVYGPGTNLSWNATGKAVGTYYYRVKASNNNGDSPWSNTQSATVLPPASGPTPGYWRNASGTVEFYVTPDRAYVDRFAFQFSISGCGTVKLTHISPKPAITNNSFSRTGSYYFSGTFTSSTSASGSAGLSNHYIYPCGYVTGGPWSWTATWQNSSQPSSLNAGVTENTLIEFVPEHSDSYRATAVR
jgi:hypothetical protein